MGRGGGKRRFSETEVVDFEGAKGKQNGGTLKVTNRDSLKGVLQARTGGREGGG